jgi:hypothetical protein
MLIVVIEDVPEAAQDAVQRLLLDLTVQPGI